MSAVPIQGRIGLQKCEAFIAVRFLFYWQHLRATHHSALQNAAGQTC